MKEKMKITLLIGLIVLLLAACGGTETPSAPVVAVTKEPTPVPEPVEEIPTAIPSEEVDSGQFTKYIGLVYPPSPENLTQVFSMLIQDKEGFSLMMVLDGANKMLWLSKVAQYDASGNPLWEVADVLNLSNLESGLTLLPDGCSLNGVLDSEILVAGRNGVVVLAWRADTALGRFEVIPTEGVQCNSDKAMPLD
jgi:hypothetical protein